MDRVRPTREFAKDVVGSGPVDGCGRGQKTPGEVRGHRTKDRFARNVHEMVGDQIDDETAGALYLVTVQITIANLNSQGSVTGTAGRGGFHPDG
jgi:hypothetical protein